MLSGTEVSIDRDRPYKTNARLKAPRSTQVSSILVFTALSATVVGPLSALARNYEADKMTVTTNDGCSASDDLQVIVLRSVEIPNAFSPNGDGINDTWQIKYLEDYTGATVSVFNRYGQFLFESPVGGYGAKPWDGTNKGNPVPVGTYFYIIKLGSGKTPLSGSVSVIR